MLNDNIQINDSKFELFLKSLKDKVEEMQLKEECVKKAFSHPLFNEGEFYFNLDVLLKYTMDSLKILGLSKPASSFLLYVEEEAKENETLRNFIDNPKSGTLLIEAYRRLKDTMGLLDKFKRGDKKAESELKRRGIL